MSKIWDALKKAELEREPVIANDGGAGETRILSGKQRAALQALLTCASLPEASAACGVSERTMQRWLKTPASPPPTGRRAARRSVTRSRS